MFAIKDSAELDEYTYKVCEISGCETEADELYEGDRTIDVCTYHYRELEKHSY